ncbi:site-2 protease family protein [Salinimicrobium gaetbulicola]|uniref:Site-2 protease family protein n=1 Tax=Salinimicrobium gaetbulicola TaxID=999702 RepID=A0ABW3IFN1_9FLAO
MFGLQDIPKFLLAFFLVLPIISILHEAGHIFFAWLMGGKNIRVIIGSGKSIFTAGIIEVRQYYFWYGFCTFENIKRKEKIANILIFSGGILFNLLSTIAVILMVESELVRSGIVTYQFTYFSLYYIFFSVLPMPYPDGNFSDGKIILDLIKGKEEVIHERTYRIKFEKNEDKWQILDYQDNILDIFEKEEDATSGARKIARQHRPSRIILIKEEKEQEIQNYPRIPL